MGLLLGAIADDVTGATDLANTLVREGMRTVQWFGVPAPGAGVPDVEAVVVALKSRTIEPATAVAQSLGALAWLRAAGARQYFFKYCSTFDSTPRGNIGPVADALLDALDAPITVVCPAFPTNGRTVYHGYLFVGSGLLSESGMKDHPLTPMTDASLVRVLARQTRHAVGLIPYDTVEEGSPAILEALKGLERAATRFAVVDALTDRHLRQIGTACADLTLVTGGSGIALGLPENFRRRGLLGPPSAADRLPPVPSEAGPAAVVAGSCSPATLAQVTRMAAVHPAFQVDPLRLARGEDVAGEALAWARPHVGRRPLLVYASAAPEEVRRVQGVLGRERAGELVEETLAAVARGLVQAGARRLVVAGGETGGAVVEALGIPGLRIGPQIDPGIPWTLSLGEPPLLLALKSGNFGAPDFFLRASEDGPPRP